jgi:5-methylcytosine-specific restriction endonuclease McrA
MQARNRTGGSAGKRLSGRRLQERRRTLIGEQSSRCVVCGLITPPSALVIDHHPKRLAQCATDPLLRSDWRDHVRLVCWDCHGDKHGSRRAVGVDGWPIRGR